MSVAVIRVRKSWTTSATITGSNNIKSQLDSAYCMKLSTLIDRQCSLPWSYTELHKLVLLQVNYLVKLTSLPL